MSETRHQHFVPKGYLREFGIGTGKDLYVWKLRLDKSNSKPERVSIGKTLCALEYFYRINPQKSFLASRLGDNANIIEDKGFPYESYLPSLLKKLNYKGVSSQTLSWVDASYLIQALVSIKFRNPYMRNIYEKGVHVIEENLPIAKQQILKIVNKISPQDTLLLNYANELKKKFEYDAANPKELLTTLHSVALQIGSDENLMDQVKNLVNHLLNAQWEIVQTNFQHQFITSDNPGIFLNQEIVLSLIFEAFEKLGLDRFFFPLSPLHGLVIHLSKKDSCLSTSEHKVIPITYSPKRVAEYNICHCPHANQILIASSKIALIEAAEIGKSSWLEIRESFAKSPVI